jgi:hypothetical protein
MASHLIRSKVLRLCGIDRLEMSLMYDCSDLFDSRYLALIKVREMSLFVFAVVSAEQLPWKG